MTDEEFVRIFDDCMANVRGTIERIAFEVLTAERTKLVPEENK